MGSVSSHGGARPSHAVWQGRCYSLDGEREIDGVVYRDFRTATGYGTGAGLCGWNCRHSFGPYRHGAPRQYEPNPVSETGYTDAELYALSQKQRACERAIRAAKRELVGARRLYESDPSVANQVAVERARRKVADRQAKVRKLVSDANARCAKGTALLRRPDREWVAGYDGAGKSEASGRTLDEALAAKGAAAAREKAGVTKKAHRDAVRASLAANGVTVPEFRLLSRSEQNSIVSEALTRRKPTDLEKRRAGMKPVNEALYNSLKNYVERHGCVVIRGGKEAEEHLAKTEADAVYITGGGPIYFHENPTTSEVLEEVYHFKQDMRGDYSEDGNIVIIKLRREIDAQRYLLSVANQYNIPESESEQTRDALDGYMRKLKRVLEGEDPK